MALKTENGESFLVFYLYFLCIRIQKVHSMLMYKETYRQTDIQREYVLFYVNVCGIEKVNLLASQDSNSNPRIGDFRLPNEMLLITPLKYCSKWLSNG